MIDTPPLLSLQTINFAYRALPVLRNISWHWSPGQQWACIGPNGAGKTTLAGVLSKQLDWGSGTLQRNFGNCSYVCFEQHKALCDRDQRQDDSEFRSDARDPGTTVEEAAGAVDRDDLEIHDWIARLGLGHILKRGIRFISTGEMRKTLLLRAILQNPDLLILDSPLDGLDKQSQSGMRDILEHLLASGMHILLLSRSLDDIPDGVSHLLILEQGQVLDSGPREQVLANPGVIALMNPPAVTLGELPTQAARAYQLSDTEPLLELRNVSVNYGDAQILQAVDWTFQRRQHCNISGPNGCGKTTLLSLVTGDNHKAYGQDITLFGRRRGSGESVWDIKQKFGQLNTQLHLNFARGMRVQEVVVSGFFDTVGLFDDWGDKQLEIARDWLSSLGLGAIQEASFDTLSFGLQRMVLLARAMVKSPAILILDEPCLGLDRHHTRTIIGAMDHIATHCDTQLVYVSHSRGEMPACINQWLEFVPGEAGFTLQCREVSAPAGRAAGSS